MFLLSQLPRRQNEMENAAKKKQPTENKKIPAIAINNIRKNLELVIGITSHNTKLRSLCSRHNLVAAWNVRPAWCLVEHDGNRNKNEHCSNPAEEH